MVTAEMAVTIPVLISIAALLAWFVGVAAAQGHVDQAARDGARAAARGDSEAKITKIAEAVAPGSKVSITNDDGLATVRVRKKLSSPWGSSVSWTLDASVSAVTE